MFDKLIKNILLVLVGGIMLVSCKVTQTYQSPEVNTADLYRDIISSDTNSIANLPYSDLFTDKMLQNLIKEGISNNLDLKMAYERIGQSQAYYLQSKGAFLPGADANAGVNYGKQSQLQGGKSGFQFQLGVSSNWELDIWDKLGSSSRAAFANLLQTEAASKAIQTEIVAGIANYYYTLLALDQQLAITQQTVRNWDTTVVTMRALKDAARVTEAAVVQSQAQKYAAEVTIPDLKQRIKEVENALSILMGVPPQSISRGLLSDEVVHSTLNTGVSTQLLSNRPDVMQAEYNFRNLFELTNVARTYFYPSLNITASVGLTAFAIDKLFSADAFNGSIGGGLLQPILNRRLNKTRLTVAQSQQQQALLNYQNTLLNAGREVSDAMSLYETATSKEEIRNNQINALEKSVQYSQELLENGFATYTEIITARQSLLQALLGKVNDRLQQLQAVVDLYRSLGGGWR
jgi:NodT family efflux transporter outer membrane factor (OMF) lipoprotein